MEDLDPATGATLSSSARKMAFRVLYEEHAVDLYRFVHRRCHDHVIAEDVTHDTFLTAVRTVDDPKTIHRGWLRTVARNRLIDKIRRQSTQERKLHLVASPSSEPAQEAALVERARVEAAMAELSAVHRVVLALHYVDGMTVEAIAADLGRSAKAVEGLVTRARRNLRRGLEESWDE